MKIINKNMNNASKWIVGIVIVLLVIWGGYSYYQNQKQISVEPVKIGAILPLSGDLANLGEGARDAILLAKENLNRTKYNYDIIFEDDQFDSAKTATAFQKLISVDKVKAVISFASGPANVISPIAEQNKIIHFGIASDPNAAKGDYNFMHWTPPSEEAKTFIAELQKRGIKKFAILEQNQQGIMATTNAIKEKLQGTNIEIVADEKFDTKDRDFRSLIAKVKSNGAELYLLEAFPPQLEILVKQIREAKISTPITSIELVESSNESMGLFEGNWYINAAEPINNFNETFKQKYGSSPVIAAGNYYDIINLFISAYEKAGKYHRPSPEEVVNELNQTKDFKGALGVLNMGPDGIILSNAIVKIIKDGKPVIITD